MKGKLTILALTLVVFACQPTAQEEAAPQDLDGKKALLREKQDQLQKLTLEISQLEAEIVKLDPSTARRNTLVTTIPVTRKTFERFVDIQGAVKATDIVNAAAEVPGRIIKLNVKEGQLIAKGSLIAELDLEQLNKQIDELDKSLELAREVYQRQQRLWEQNIGSELQYLEAKNNVERLEKSKATLEFQLTKSKVYAPISGVVDMVNLEAGELAMTGAPIVQILNTNSLKVVADVPENYLQSVRRGATVSVKYPSLDLEQTRPISLIGSTIDEANRTFKVEINVGNPNGQLKPNLLAIMLLKEYAEEDAVAIPLELVQQEVGGKKYVFVSEEGKDGPVAKKIYVTTGESYEGEIIITDGLAGGEELIDKGARGLSANQPITIQNPKTAATNG